MNNNSVPITKIIIGLIGFLLLFDITNAMCKSPSINKNDELFLVGGIGDDIYIKQVPVDKQYLHSDACVVFGNEELVAVLCGNDVMSKARQFLFFEAGNFAKDLWLKKTSHDRLPHNLKKSAGEKFNFFIQYIHYFWGDFVQPGSHTEKALETFVEKLGLNRQSYDSIKPVPLDTTEFIEERKKNLHLIKIGNDGERKLEEMNVKPLFFDILFQYNKNSFLLFNENGPFSQIFLWVPRIVKEEQTPVKLNSGEGQNVENGSSVDLYLNEGQKEAAKEAFFKYMIENESSVDLSSVPIVHGDLEPVEFKMNFRTAL